MVKPTPVSAPAPKSPMLILAGTGQGAASAAMTKPSGGGFYNPFDRPKTKSLTAAPPPLTPPEPTRAPFRVVAKAPPVGQTFRAAADAQQRPAMRPTSLVLVSGVASWRDGRR